VDAASTQTSTRTQMLSLAPNQRHLQQLCSGWHGRKGLKLFFRCPSLAAASTRSKCNGVMLSWVTSSSQATALSGTISAIDILKSTHRAQRPEGRLLLPYQRC